MFDSLSNSWKSCSDWNDVSLDHYKSLVEERPGQLRVGYYDFTILPLSTLNVMLCGKLALSFSIAVRDRSLFGYCYFLRGLSALVLPLHWSIFLTKGTPTLGINPNVKKGGVIEIQPESCSSTASVGGYSQGNLAFLQWFHLIFSRLRASLQSFKELTIACGRYLQARAGYSSELARVYFIMQVKCGVILELRSWFRGHLCRSHGVRQPNPMAMWGAKHGLFSCSLVSTWPGGSVSNLSTQLLNKQTDPYSESGRLFPLLPCSQAGELKNKEVLWHVTIS